MNNKYAFLRPLFSPICIILELVNEWGMNVSAMFARVVSDKEISLSVACRECTPGDRIYTKCYGNYGKTVKGSSKLCF